MNVSTAAAEGRLLQPFAELRRRIEAELQSHFGDADASAAPVRSAMRDGVLAGGKRLRPIMTAVAARDLGFAGEGVYRAGCAVELVHTASLILDDLPCMDDADLRRGQPAVHIRYGEDIAILAAIALLSEAYAVAASLPGASGEQSARIVAALSGAIGIGGLVSGQFTDLRGGPGAAGDRAALNDQKTGALFVASLEIARILAGADERTGRALGRYGAEIGRAFQHLDDLLDLDGDAERAGKTLGRDAGRATLVRQIGREPLVEIVHGHVEAAREALREMPRPADGLLALTDFMFGIADSAFGRPSEALLFSLLAR